MKFAFLLCVGLLGISLSRSRRPGNKKKNNNSAKNAQNVPDLIRADGYPVQIHHVTSADGYTLELHRIPRGRNESEAPPRRKEARPPVLLLHCIMCSSAAFVVLGPNGGLAYMLANSGRDVWMLNTRGTKYSRHHEWLPPDSREFWQFSWHEQGIFDVPAAIDYILDETKEEKLDAVGYSIGSTQLFVLLSERPQYNHKVRSATVIAPAVFIEGARWSLLTVSASFLRTVVSAAASTGQLEASGAALGGLNRVLSRMCSPFEEIKAMCSRAISFVGGKSNGNVNKKFLPFFFKFIPDATSLRSLVHFHQNYERGDFRKYSYGRRLNQKVYGSAIPPAYNLSRVTSPTTVIWSEGDDVTVPQDVKKLISILPNIVSTYEIPDKSYSHIDFMWARTAHILVNKVIVKKLKTGK